MCNWVNEYLIHQKSEYIRMTAFVKVEKEDSISTSIHLVSNFLDLRNVLTRMFPWYYSLFLLFSILLFGYVVQ